MCGRVWSGLFGSFRWRSLVGSDSLLVDGVGLLSFGACLPSGLQIWPPLGWFLGQALRGGNHSFVLTTLTFLPALRGFFFTHQDIKRFFINFDLGASCGPSVLRCVQAKPSDVDDLPGIIDPALPEAGGGASGPSCLCHCLPFFSCFFF